MLSVKLTDQIFLGFPLPIFHEKIGSAEKTNEAVFNYLMSERLRANAESLFDWSSSPDLHMRDDPALKVISGLFADAIVHLTRLEFEEEIPVPQITISGDMWGCLSRQGSVRSAMNFAPLNWRGIYFVRCHGASIELVDPKGPRPIPGTGKYGKKPRKITITPEAGSLIVFPAWVTHSIIQDPGYELQATVEIAAGVLVTEEETKK